MIEKFLSDIELEDGTVIRFYQSTSLCYSPAYSYFLKSTAEMIDDEFILPLTDWTDTRCGIIYGKFENKVISFLMYDLDYDLQNRKQAILISKTFVEEKYRCNGIYSNMEKLLIAFAKELGYTSIATILSKNNNTFSHCLKKLGSSFVCYRTWKKLND
jgi:predicted GNAT family acetyltransferase